MAKEIYGAKGVVYEPVAEKQIAKIESLGFGGVPVCMAKNQYSLSDDAKKLGRPEGFDIHIREVYVNARRRVCGRSYRRDHDDAGTAEGTGGERDRCHRRRKDHRAVLNDKGEI